MRIEPRQHHGLIAAESRGAVHGMRVAPSDPEIALRAGDEEAARLVEGSVVKVVEK